MSGGGAFTTANKSRGWGLIAAVLGIIVLLLGLVLRGLLGGADSKQGFADQQPLPRFQLMALGQNSDAAASFDSEQLRGKPWLLNLWASWCPPCRDEWPQLEALGADGLTLVGVNDSDQKSSALAWLDQAGNPFNHSLVNDQAPADASKDSLSHIPSPGLPTSYLIGRDGTIRARFVGPLTHADVQKLQHLLNTEAKP